VQESIDNVSDMLDAMQYCVAWLIEDSFRGKTTGALQATLGDITKNIDGSYTVPLQFSGDRVIDTTWVSEFGIWKLDKAGDLVSGDKTLVEKKAKKQATDKKLRTDYTFSVFAGYAYLGLGGDAPRESAADISFEFGSGFNYAVNLLIQGGDFGIAEFQFGYTGAIRLDTVAFMPYGALGFGVSWHEKDYETDYYTGPEEKLASNFSMGLSAQGGLKFTTSYVPGLFVKAAYQFSYYPGGSFFQERNIPLKDVTHGIIIGAGYLF
jgi:hypothetical protein